MRESTQVSVKIASPTIDAEAMSALLGLKPDRSWKIGAVRGVFGVTEKQHGFLLESTCQPSEDLNAHLKAMIKRLAPCAQKVGALGADVTVEFACRVERKRAPVLHFERDDLRWLAVMGARLDIDTVIVSEPPSGPAKTGQPPA